MPEERPPSSASTDAAAWPTARAPHRGNSLGELAAAANREHRACGQAYGSASEHALRAGELLLAAKSEVEHGAWLPWLKENFLASERTAQRYTQIVREAGDPTRVSDLPVRDGLQRSP